MKIGNRDFDTATHCYVMGILNVTPDSFSDGGRWTEEKACLAHVEQMLSEGCDIIDVGGESTRPGAVYVSAEEELRRVIPVVEAIKKRFDVPVSVDTYKAEVAEQSMAAGADLINDVWGLKKDPKMAEVIAKTKAVCCLMHNRENTAYTNFMEDVASDLAETIRLAEQAGIPEEKIILDPGVGFAKSYEQNLEIIRRMRELSMFGYPILLGTSRKSVIGLTLDLPANERVEGTLVTTVMGVLNGAAFVRVHDVKENVRAIRMTEAIMGR